MEQKTGIATLTRPDHPAHRRRGVAANGLAVVRYLLEMRHPVDDDIGRLLA
jgi:hypothetical protein